MPATYPLELRDEIESMHAGISYLKSIGLPYDVLGAFLGVPPGAVKAWILRGPDGFHPLLISGWSKPLFLFCILLCSLLGIWDDMERKAVNNIVIDPTWEQKEQFWKKFLKDIRSMGGIAPYKEGCQGEEIWVIPATLIVPGGLQPARIAKILADYYPIYKVKTVGDLVDICDRFADFLTADRLKRSGP